MADQRRATQNRVKMSGSARTAAGARGRVPRGWNPNAANETGSGDPADGGDRRPGVGGRSFVIHVVWNGFLLVGVQSCEACAPAPGATCDQAAGSGSAAAAEGGRNAEPATSATKALNAATTAMADRHRRVPPPPRNVTVARIYNAEPGERSERAVKTRIVGCVLHHVGREVTCGVIPLGQVGRGK